MPDKLARVFVSHSSKDVAFARRIVCELEGQGVPCWFAPRDLPPSASYPTKIIEATQNASAMIVILSRHSLQSEHVCREVEKASRLKKPLFPVKIDDEPLSGSLEYFLASLQHVDFLKGQRTDEIARLASELKKICPVSNSTGLENPDRFGRRIKRSWVMAGCVVALAALTSGALVVWQKSCLLPPNRGGGIESCLRPAPAADRFSYRAVVIGISIYRDGNPDGNEGWRNLPSARGDAEALADVLEEKYGFNVTRLFDEQASRRGVLAALDALATADSNTAVLIFFAGHGMYDGACKEGYWIPSDAGKSVGGRPAREDWIWNSTIQKIVGASEARHILVIADACYAGTLFHPNDPGNQVSGKSNEVEGSFADTSRFLIASGGMEEVPDGGRTRSAFMRAVLDEMQAKRAKPLTAQALGRSVRDRLYGETGRTIAVGPLALSSDHNGQFVFASRGELARDLVGESSRDNHNDQPAHCVASVAAEENLASVLALNRDGATNSAKRLLARLSSNKTADDEIIRAVTAYVNQESRAKAGAEIRTLIETLRKIKVQQAGAGRCAGQAAPRVLACIGPTPPSGSSSDVDTRTMLCRIVLQSQVKASGRAVVVEREQLEQILKEMQLSSSDLSAPRTRIELGRILQAGILLFGDYLPGESEDTIILRLVETETTQLLDSISGTCNPRTSAAAYTALSKQLIDSLIRACPVQAKVIEAQKRSIRINAGRLQGVAVNALYELFEGTSAGNLGLNKPFARAVVKLVNEEDSELELIGENSLESRNVMSVRAREVVPKQHDSEM